MIAGVDEAGRGCLAGPVVAAAVIFPKNFSLPVKDSKALSAKQRESLFKDIVNNAVSYRIAVVSVIIIDNINILQASLLAMHKAVINLNPSPTEVLIDGNQAPRLPFTTHTIIKGDQNVPVISAASILAKVARDRLMIQLDHHYPNYGLQIHKGYPTTKHRAAIHQYGPLPIHRKSFTLLPESISC